MEDMKIKDIEILYEDNHLLVVVKPCNLLSQADNTKDEDLLSLLKSYLKEKYNKPGNVFLGLVHRLDRPVSGIMVYAKTSKAASRLMEFMQKGQFSKYYYAIVNGIVTKKVDQLEDYLRKNTNGNSEITTKELGKNAKLNYKVKEVNKEKKQTLLEVELLTGRHHQIRVQFASRQYPLVGDQRYGKQDKKQICLHAYKLTFPHPITKEILTFNNKPKQKNDWTHFTL